MTEIINQAPRFANWTRQHTLFEVLAVIADNWLVKYAEKRQMFLGIAGQRYNYGGSKTTAGE